MQAHREAGFRESIGRALLALATVALCACSSTDGAPKPTSSPATPQQDTTGFTIVDDVRVSADTRSRYDEAVRLLAAGQSQGITLMQQVAESSPELTAAHVDLGIAWGRLGDLDKAVASLERARTLNPAHPVIHNELGMVYRKQGRFAAARSSYEEALALWSDFHFARLNLAILCDLYLGDLGCALDNYTAYHEIAPDDANAPMWIADVRNRLGDRLGQ